MDQELLRRKQSSSVCTFHPNICMEKFAKGHRNPRIISLLVGITIL
jgi:hypothetical protein